MKVNIIVGIYPGNLISKSKADIYHPSKKNTNMKKMPDNPAIKSLATWTNKKILTNLKAKPVKFLKADQDIWIPSNKDHS